MKYNQRVVNRLTGWNVQPYLGTFHRIRKPFGTIIEATDGTRYSVGRGGNLIKIK